MTVPKGTSPDVTSTPQEVTVKDRQGATVNIPLERAIELAGLGLDVQSRTADLETQSTQLREQRSLLEQDQRGYDGYRQLRTAIDANPNVGRAISQAIQQPDVVLQALEQGRVDPDGIDPVHPSHGGDPAPIAAQQAIAPEVAQQIGALESAVTVLAKSQQQRATQDAAQQLVDSVNTELGAIPWLSDKAKAHVQRTSITRLADQTNQSSPTVVVAEEIQAFKDAWEDQQRGRVATQRSRQPLRTASPDGAPGGIRPPAKMNKKSWKDGTMGKNLQAAIDDFTGAARGT